MPYFLETDTFHSEPVWEVLAEGVVDAIDRLMAAYSRMKSLASHLTSNGYLTERGALSQCHGRKKVLDLLCTAVLEEKPLVHRQGDECDCLGDSWVEGYAYRIHNFLKRNPSRREYNLNQHQKADLRNAALKQLVYQRDGGCCRYCTSGPLSPKAGRSKDRRKILHFDHVDPDQIAGAEGENFVVACGRCNEEKGHRTPDEADMVLLAVRAPEVAYAMRHRPMELHDRPPVPAPSGPADQPQTSDEPATNQRISDQNTDQEQKPITDPVSDPITDHEQRPIADPMPPVSPSPTTTATEHDTNQGAEGSGMGRGGTHDLVPPLPAYPGLPARTSDSPDVYSKRSRSATPPPAFISAEPEWPPPWPAGSVPPGAPIREQR